MKDWNAEKDADASTDRWIGWEAALVGFLFVLGLAGVLLNLVVALV